MCRQQVVIKKLFVKRVACCFVINRFRVYKDATGADLSESLQQSWDPCQSLSGALVVTVTQHQPHQLRVTCADGLLQH